MSCLLSNISVQVKAAQGKVAERFLHEVRPGDFVVIRDHRRKSWRSKKVARAFPGASGDAHGSEGRREGYVGSRGPWRRVPPIAEAEQLLEEVQRECQ